MRTNQKFVPYDSAVNAIRTLAKEKYLKDPENAVKCIPNETNTELVDVIEVLYNSEHINVEVSREDLRNIHWDAYLESSDDGVFLPYAEDNFEGDLLGDENELY